MSGWRRMTHYYSRGLNPAQVIHKSNGKRTQMTQTRYDRKGWPRAAWFAAGGVPIFTVTAAWFIHRWVKLDDSLPYFLGAVGNLCALIGLPILIALVVIGTRFFPAERVFGLDRMLRLHKNLGTVAVALFSVHAVLRFLKASLKLDYQWQWQMFFSLETGDATAWGMNLARLGLVGLLVSGGLARLGDFQVLSFKTWKPAHLAVYIAVAAGLVHARIVGDDIIKSPYNGVWYAAVAAFVVLCVYRLRYVARRNRQCVTTLREQRPDAHNVHTCFFENDIIPERRAGQFCLLRFKSGGAWSEPRPFTISAGARTDTPSVTVKKIGRFTTELDGLQAGTPLLCEGPYGVFYPDFTNEKNIVMLAGGIGVTPFLSMIRTAVEDDFAGRLTLLWNNKTCADIITQAELTDSAANGRLKLVHVISREQPPPQTAGSGVYYEHGHIRSELLQRHVVPTGASFYLCGPQGMQHSVLKELRSAFNISPRQVHRELFFW